jgi:hypothetical protein
VNAPARVNGPAQYPTMRRRGKPAFVGYEWSELRGLAEREERGRLPVEAFEAGEDRRDVRAVVVSDTETGHDDLVLAEAADGQPDLGLESGRSHVWRFSWTDWLMPRSSSIRPGRPIGARREAAMDD